MTAQLARALGLEAALLPASDDPVRTFLETPAGTFPFQTWFVARATATRSTPCTTPGRRRRRRRPGSLEALAEADLIVIAPSNPYVSIGPILAVGEIRERAGASEPSRAWPSARWSEGAR